MATLLTILLALLLAAYLIVCGRRWGVPDMISDTYYQGAGKWFSALMAVEAISIAFEVIKYEDNSFLWTTCGLVGCAGLLTVGLVPMYHHCDKCHWAHKAGAYVAAAGCLSWCMAVNPLPVMYVAILYAAHMVGSAGQKPWYVAEICGFLAVFTTLLFSS